MTSTVRCTQYLSRFFSHHSTDSSSTDTSTWAVRSRAVAANTTRPSSLCWVSSAWSWPMRRWWWTLFAWHWPCRYSCRKCVVFFLGKSLFHVRALHHVGTPRFFKLWFSRDFMSFFEFKLLRQDSWQISLLFSGPGSVHRRGPARV